MRFVALLFLAAVGYACTGSGAVAVYSVLRTNELVQPLLRNGDFGSLTGGKPDGWSPAPNGFAVDSLDGRGGSSCLRCENEHSDGYTGASQTVLLDRQEPCSLLVRGWSKAEKVSGSRDSDYSLYVDIVYQDGEPLWGQTAGFQTGTHDWQQRELIILPQKPVRSLTIYCLFRNHTGRAWFDDISIEEMGADNRGLVLEGTPVQATGARARPEGRPVQLQSRDDLRLTVCDSAVTSLRAGGRELVGQAPSGFLVRDVAADSDFFAFERGECPELGLQLQARFRASADHIVIEGRIQDTTKRDRAVTLMFALPIDATGWTWEDDIRQRRVIRGGGNFSQQVSVGCGATGGMSQYPLGAICGRNVGLALAIDMAQPAQYRIGYHAEAKHFYLAYDFGLVPESQKFPGASDFRFVLYRFDPEWGFRAAFEKLMRIFPEYFVVRSRDQGLWMPFTDISTVKDWQDFGFKYHEGNNNVVWDDAHGVLSFRYTEPMTWWMRMAKGRERTPAEAIRVRDQLADGAEVHSRRMAEVSRVAGMSDDSGQPCLLFRNEPWCDGAVWSLNPNPALKPGEPGPKDKNHEAFNAATVCWNPAIREALYGASARGGLDGEYLDSLEGYVTADLNFRRNHFVSTTVPLTFAADTKRPALYKGLAVFEFAKWIGDQVHALNKLTFANGVPYRFSFLCPWLDVMGTETDWLANGKYRPASDTQMSLWRTMAGQKPYLLLMNTDYDVFTGAMVERYFQRSLFYGMFPGMFSHNAADNPYWQNPRWYERDRPLFRKYLPLIKQVAEAGWQPVTGARGGNDRIFLERFGPDPAGQTYLTLFNDTTEEQVGRVSINKQVLRVVGGSAGVELVSGEAVADVSAGWQVTLAPQEVQVVRFQATRR